MLREKARWTAPPVSAMPINSLDGLAELVCERHGQTAGAFLQTESPLPTRPARRPSAVRAARRPRAWRTTTYATSPNSPTRRAAWSIHYDQIGCGRSTHLPEPPAEFWTPDLFVDEFHAVRDRAGRRATTTCLASLGAACSAPKSPFDSRRGCSPCRSATPRRRWSCGWPRRDRLRAQLPADVQAALDRHEAAGTVTDPEYLAATQEFYRRHVCRVEPTPHDFVDSEHRWRPSRRCTTP